MSLAPRVLRPRVNETSSSTNDTNDTNETNETNETRAERSGEDSNETEEVSRDEPEDEPEDETDETEDETDETEDEPEDERDETPESSPEADEPVETPAPVGSSASRPTPRTPRPEAGSSVAGAWDELKGVGSGIAAGWSAMKVKSRGLAETLRDYARAYEASNSNSPTIQTIHSIDDLIRTHRGDYAEVRFTVPYKKLRNFTNFLNHVYGEASGVSNRIVLEHIYDRGEIIRSSRAGESTPHRRVVSFTHYNLLSFPTGPDSTQRVSLEVCRNIPIAPEEQKMLRNKASYPVRYHEREYPLEDIGATLFIRTASTLKAGSHRVQIQEKIDAAEEAHYRLSVNFDTAVSPFTGSPVKTQERMKGRFRQLLEPLEKKIFGSPYVRENKQRYNDLAHRYNKIRANIDEQGDLFYKFIEWIEEIKVDYEKTCDNDDEAIKIAARLDNVRSDQRKLELNINAIMTEIESLGIYGNLLEEPVMLKQTTPKAELPYPTNYAHETALSYGTYAQEGSTEEEASSAVDPRAVHASGAKRREAATSQVDTPLDTPEEQPTPQAAEVYMVAQNDPDNEITLSKIYHRIGQSHRKLNQELVGLSDAIKGDIRAQTLRELKLGLPVKQGAFSRTPQNARSRNRTFRKIDKQ